MNQEQYTLALYDIRGIQNFIFNTNKLKENVGGSFLIESILEDFKVILKRKLEKVGENYINFSDVIDINQIDIEILPIYIAGGNALILYKNKELEKEVTQTFSQYILEKTGNELAIMVATQDILFKELSKDIEKLNRRMHKNKAQFIQYKPQGGIGITRLENQTELPAQFHSEQKYLSFPTYIKRKYEEKSKNYYENRLIENNNYLKGNKNWEFPRNLDKLGFHKGEHHIALVHLDGNSMGELVKNLIKNESDYARGLYIYRKFSTELEFIILNAMRRTIADLIYNINDLEKEEIIKQEKNKKNYKSLLPIRPIILSGDDITFISHGLLGVGLAENFIKNLNKERQEEKYKIDLLKNNISISGGVLVTNYKFPFARSYPLLEELTKSAKLKGKICNPNTKNNDNLFSWLDFQILNSGISSDLETMRRQQYNCPGCLKPVALEKIINNNYIRMEQYNLLYRPWAILGKWGKNETYSRFEWVYFEKKINHLKSYSSKWPRSQLKNLQKSFHISKDKVREVILENKRRNRELEDALGLESKEWTQTPYYDIIELIDYYNKIPLTTEEI